MTEADIMRGVLLELCNPTRWPECWLARNNVGILVDRNGQHVAYGCGGKGAADLVGIWTHPDGRGQFIAIETKKPDTKQTPEQRTYEALVTQRGGVYVVVRSVEEAQQWAEQMRRGK